ncbi:uncharacterized protein DUF1453 [Streptomyces sp. TLI_235]|nr:CcdC protein domain-containing protein [Streptomyces sp. TLI_235]PBC77451.1 uncharacterized protein DUF1453 [Streptomyces sp. TLI_235]
MPSPSALANVLIAVAVVVLVVGRQMKARRVDTDRRFWLVPLVLAVVALRDPALVDRDHEGAAVAVLAGSLVTVLAMGCVWGWTVRLWGEADGTVWAKGTRATLAAWAGMIVLRIGWYVLGGALHVHQGSAVLLLSLAGLLLVRGAVLKLRVAQRFDGVAL